jgi:polyhydroxyalkanoate synthesis regulator phasin
VNFICNLETNGKLSPEEAYNQIKNLWKQLKSAKKQLGIGES